MRPVSCPSNARRATYSPGRHGPASAESRDAGREDEDRSSEPLWLHAADGYRLGATRFRAHGPVRAHVVVAGAIGIPQGFYRRFAAHAQARGNVVWTVDYRGVGRSAPRALRGFRADLLDWARLDLAAAVGAAAELAAHDGVPVHVVAHSFGGCALGFLPDPGHVHAGYTFGTGAGWHGWMPARERARVLAMWHLVMPVLTRLRGYAPWSRFGAADLPLGVYRQWKRWCRRPGYCFDDPTDGAALRVAGARLTLPLAAAAATDDPWSPPRSRDAFLAGFPHAAVTRVDLDPATAGTGLIGHLGYFRPSARPLWDAALDWLAAQSTDVAGAPRAAS